MIASLPLTPTGLGESWQIKGVYSQPDSYNYLGGALGPQQELVVAGWSPDVGLKIIRSTPPYTSFQQTSTLAMQGKVALYTHVAVSQNSRIALLSVESPNNQKCAEVNQILTNYKNIHYYEADYNDLPNSLKYSDSPSDFHNSSSFNPCSWRNLRYPLDLFYDLPKNRFLYITQKSDLTLPYTSYPSNNNYIQYFS